MVQRHQVARRFAGDTDDRGIKPGGICDRAMRAVDERGPQLEMFEKTAASIRYWLRDAPAALVEAKLRALAARLGGRRCD
jgi:hypothetical protein